MFKMFSSYFVGFVIGLYFVAMPQNVFGAEVTFSLVPNNLAQDKSTIVEVRIDPQSKLLNVVEGRINFQGKNTDNLSIEILSDQSVLAIWPTPPQYFPAEKIIRFIGGVPNGFDEEGLLFRVRLPASLSEDLMISWIGGTAYLNDGKGTKEIVYAKPFIVTFNQNDSVAVHKSNEASKYNVIIVLILATIFLFFSVYAYKKIIKK